MSLVLAKTDMPSWECNDTIPLIHEPGRSELFVEIESNASFLDDTGNPPVAEIALLAEHGVLADAARWAQGIVSQGSAAPELALLRDFLRRLGGANLSIARLFEGHFNALYLICRYGTPPQMAAAARDAQAGLLFAVWNADLGNGVTLERLNDTTFSVNGAKRFASGTGLVRRPIVTATHGDGRFMTLLPLHDDDAMFSPWTASGMRASISGEAPFDGVEIDDQSIIGADGDYYRQPQFSSGAWRFLAAQFGAVETLVDHLQAHLIATGRSTDMLQQARLGEALVALETARLWVHQSSMTSEDRTAKLENRVAYVNLARHAVERAALDVIEIVQRSVGLSAFLKPHPIERICRDLTVYLRQPAPDQALLAAARHALDAKAAQI